MANIKNKKPKLADDSLTSRSSEIIKQIQQKRGRKALFFLCHQSISHITAIKLNRFLRNMDVNGELDVILDSGGGDLVSAYKIIDVLKAHAEKVTIIVPFRAKSAATLIALGCDELIMCKIGELGPVDPQVMDPQTGNYVPAHSIKEALDFITSINDDLVKMNLTEKIPVLLVGAYRASEKTSKQYLGMIFSNKDTATKNDLINIFTEKFLSHGHPINRKFLAEHKIAMTDIDKDLENLVYDLAEECENFCSTKYLENPMQAGEMMLLLSEDNYMVMLGQQTLTERIPI